MTTFKCPRCGDHNGAVIIGQPHWQLIKCRTCEFLEWVKAEPEPSEPPQPRFDNARQLWNIPPGAIIHPQRLRLDVVAFPRNGYSIKVLMREDWRLPYKLWMYFPRGHNQGYEYLDQLFEDFWEWLFKWYEVK